MTLLDIGCGWGATMRRAIEKYDVNVVGLTLSENQAKHVQEMFEEMDTPRTRRVLLEGWEKFDEPVDRIVSIGAFEHFGRQRWGHFFEMAHRVLPADGVMLLHTICRPTFKDARAQGRTLTHEIIHFTQFILAEIFPGGWLPTIPSVRRARDRGRFQGDADRSRCSCTTPGRWRSGPPRSRPTGNRPSPSSRGTSTTGT